MSLITLLQVSGAVLGFTARARDDCGLDTIRAIILIEVMGINLIGYSDFTWPSCTHMFWETKIAMRQN